MHAHVRAYDENKNLPNIHSIVATLPQRAQIKLLFALWQAVFEIEPIYMHAHVRMRAHTMKIKICLYVYINTPGGPN